MNSLVELLSPIASIQQQFRHDAEIDWARTFRMNAHSMGKYLEIKDQLAAGAPFFATFWALKKWQKLRRCSPS
jgi:hypothetical protein